MRKNQIKEKLAAGTPVYGAMVQFPDPDLVEILGYAGFDWILIDAEHGSINENDCLGMVRACELANTTSIVRPPTNHPEIIMRFLDCGAQGIQAPRVNTAEDARAVVDAVKYHPAGKRGVTSSSRSVRYGFGGSIPDCMRFSNAETLVCVMIEELEAVRNLPQILRVDGVDVFFVGGGDLAQTMGFPGKKSAPEVHKVVCETIDRIVAAGKIAGYSCEEETREFVRRGVRYFHTGMTPLMKFAARHFWSLVGEQRI
ncbi:MAG: 2-dehydro-3-deoxyglucarate aldolase [Betaproteobacteria bacterium]|nr:2-dehydro-3-deoxyglucarate aldolase [Betaproteobacteria bacterium]